jgi:hypothetical protein
MRGIDKDVLPSFFGSSLFSAKATAIPIMNRKNGNTQSLGLKPFHYEIIRLHSYLIDFKSTYRRFVDRPKYMLIFVH